MLTLMMRRRGFRPALNAVVLASGLILSCHDLDSVQRPSADGALSDHRAQDALPDLLQPDAGPLPLPAGLCNAEGFCWMHPLPQGEGLNSVQGNASGETYAVGDKGTLLRHDGTGWALEDPGVPGTTDLLGVWSDAAGSAYAVGSAGALIQRTNGKWSKQTPLTSQDLQGIWGSGSACMTVVGGGGSIYHHVGAGLTRAKSGVLSSLTAVWGSSCTDIHVVGLGGTAVHFDGTDWKQAPTGVTEDLAAV